MVQVAWPSKSCSRPYTAALRASITLSPYDKLLDTDLYHFTGYLPLLLDHLALVCVEQTTIVSDVHFLR